MVPIKMSASIVLSLFLIFGQFEPRCSYKIVLIKSVNMQRKNIQNEDVNNDTCMFFMHY